jgi:hypothetical protein
MLYSFLDNFTTFGSSNRSYFQLEFFFLLKFFFLLDYFFFILFYQEADFVLPRLPNQNLASSEFAVTT